MNSRQRNNNGSPSSLLRDEQPDYWQRENKFAQQADQYFNQRLHGQKPFSNQANNGPAYHIPLSQKVQLVENPRGGLPKFRGAISNLPNFESVYGRLDPSQGFMNTTLASQQPSFPQSPMQGGYQNNNGFVSPAPPSPSPAMEREIDPGVLLAQRAMFNQTPAVSQQQFPQQTQNYNQNYEIPTSIGGTCTLIEGKELYQPLNTQGFPTGANLPTLIKSGGVIRGAAGQQFEIRRVVNCYRVDGLRTVDLSKMEQDRVLKLVEIVSPYNKSFLVSQDAIQMNQETRQHYQPQRQQLLVDARQNQAPRNHHQMPQQGYQPAPQQQRNNPGYGGSQLGADLLRRRGMLKG